MLSYTLDWIPNFTPSKSKSASKSGWDATHVRVSSSMILLSGGIQNQSRVREILAARSRIVY